MMYYVVIRRTEVYPPVYIPHVASIPTMDSITLRSYLSHKPGPILLEEAKANQADKDHDLINSQKTPNKVYFELVHSIELTAEQAEQYVTTKQMVSERLQRNQKLLEQKKASSEEKQAENKKRPWYHNPWYKLFQKE